MTVPPVQQPIHEPVTAAMVERALHAWHASTGAASRAMAAWAANRTSENKRRLEEARERAREAQERYADLYMAYHAQVTTNG